MCWCVNSARMIFVLLQNFVLLALMARLLFKCEVSSRSLGLTEIIPERTMDNINKDCSDEWFGEDCMFQCHCYSSTKCERDGSCPANDRCAIGYFGLGCQFADLVPVYSLPAVPPFLRDSNDTTCNPNKGATSVTLSLTRYILLSWFRIIVNNNRSLLKFTTNLSSDGLCLNERKLMFGSNGVDVMCDGSTNSSVLKIEGLIAGDICTVYISGGRNFALKQKTSQSSTLNDDTDTYGSDNAVDGSSDVNYTQNHCSRTDKQIKPPEYNITFDKVYYVSYILLITKKAHSSTLNGSLIEGFDEDNKRVFSHRETLATMPPIYWVQLTSYALAKKITVKQSSDLVEAVRFMAICEVLVFGECKPKSFGIYCGLSCSEGCVETCHSDTGRCACNLGYRGERCTECDAGFHGSKCNLTCPRFCADGLCDRYTRECLTCTQNHAGPQCEECSLASHGPSCDLACSLFCLGGVCDTYTGECLMCVKNRFGPFCEDCIFGFYGPDCNFTCPPFCDEGICYTVNGVCIGCLENHVGAYCEECAVGRYGYNCSYTCSLMCDGGRCQRNTGYCEACANRNRTGRFCEECPEKFYGPECTTPCSSNCLDKKCYSSTGYCLSCHETHTGLHCDIENIFDSLTSSTVFCEKGLVTMLSLLLALLIIFV